METETETRAADPRRRESGVAERRSVRSQESARIWTRRFTAHGGLTSSARPVAGSVVCQAEFSGRQQPSTASDDTGTDPVKRAPGRRSGLLRCGFGDSSRPMSASTSSVKGWRRVGRTRFGSAHAAADRQRVRRARVAGSARARPAAPTCGKRRRLTPRMGRSRALSRLWCGRSPIANPTSRHERRSLPQSRPNTSPGDCPGRRGI